MTKVFDENDYIFHQAIWFVSLSNGETIYQDDYREGQEPHSAWLRLKRYLSENNLNIISFGFRFRSNILNIEIPDWSEGIFFCKKTVGMGFGGNTVETVVVGFVKENLVYTSTFTVPALVLHEKETREKESCEFGIIYDRTKH